MRSSTVLMFIVVVVPYFSGRTLGYSINLLQASKDIEALRQYYNTHYPGDREDNKVDGNLFMTVLELWKGEEEKKIVLSQIVPMYRKMLDSIKTAELQKNVKNIKHILDVPNEEILNQSSQKLKQLNELSSIQMTDTKTQLKAIQELFPVLQAISCLVKESCVTSKRKREFLRKRRARQN